MNVLEDLEEFFVDFVKFFAADVAANGGNLAAAAVEAAVDAAEQAFFGVDNSGKIKKDFAFGNAIASLEAQGVPLVKESVTHVINGLIEMSVAKLNKQLGV